MLRVLRAGSARRFKDAATQLCVYTSHSVGPEHYDIPAGHAGSDMRSTACNIGLNRRRDLSLRADVLLHTSEKSISLTDLLRDKMVVLLGVPDMGKVCAECHVPNYVDKAKELYDSGIEHIYCVAVADPEKAENWAKGLDLKDSKITMLGDKNGGFARLLGVDINIPKSDPPHQQRYSALIEDGVLLKLKVEHELKDVKESSAECILEYIQYLKSLE